MRLSCRWLGELLDLSDVPPEEIARRLTFHTAEVEASEPRGADLDDVRSARVLAVAPHPGADKLRLCDVDRGDGAAPVRVVCGAPNVAAGQVVGYAPEGATLPGGPDGPLRLERRVIRGVESRGMVCSARELGLGEDHDGILVLPPDTPLGVSLADVLGLRDTVLEVANVSITHRPDLWGHVGFARELGAMLRRPLRRPAGLDAARVPTAPDAYPVTVEDPEGCRRYVGLVLEGLRNGPSPLALRQRIEALGLRSISLLVDLTNLVLLEQGQPLHAFDLRAVQGGEVRVRRAAPGERLSTLDGVVRSLEATDLVIADARTPLALAGVMGGSASEVRPDTTAILLESANFDPATVRRTATRLNLRTEASSRFEKGLDPDAALHAALRFAALAAEHCPDARVARAPSDVRPRPAEAVQLELPYALVRRRLGLRIPDVRVRAHLDALGFGVRETDTGVRVDVPTWRRTGDVRCPEDLVEEVGRLEGYERIEPMAPVAPLAPVPVRAERDLERRVGAALSLDLGYAEVKHRSFHGERIARALGLEGHEHLRVRNPTSEEHDRLALTTAGNLLVTVAANQPRETRGRIWESTRIIRPRGAPGLAVERAVLGLATWDREDEDMPAGALFLRLVSDLRTLAGRLGIEDVRVADAGAVALAEGFPPATWLHPGRRATLHAGGRLWGVVGEVAPGVRRAMDVAGRAACAELDAQVLAELAAPEGAGYEPVLRFPVVPFDVAVIVPRRTPADDLCREVSAAAVGNVRDVHVFDVFEGGVVPAGHRSIAVRCELFDAGATLSPAAADALRARILDALTARGWTVRGA